MEIRKKRSDWWYFFPIAFGVFGGVITYFIVKNSDKTKAKYCLLLGVAASILWFVPGILAMNESNNSHIITGSNNLIEKNEFSEKTLPEDEEPEPVDFCNSIMTFKDDVDEQCNDRFYRNIAEVCILVEPDMDIDTCVLDVVVTVWEDCIEYEETFNVPQDICIYEKLKNINLDFESEENNE